MSDANLFSSKLTVEGKIRLERSAIVNKSANMPRASWAEAAKTMHERGENVLLAPVLMTKFDENEWEWDVVV